MTTAPTAPPTVGHRDEPPSRTFDNGVPHGKRARRLRLVHPSQNPYRAVPYTMQRDEPPAVTP